MIQHVWQRAQLLDPKIETIVATDSRLIQTECEKFKAKTVLTKKSHINGLSRAGEVSKKLNWDFYIILQADEILFDPKDLKKLINKIKLNKNYDLYNLVAEINNVHELEDKNTVKCIIRRDYSILSFQRKSSSIAPNKDQLAFTKKVCGVYAISKKALDKINISPETPIEKAESIEQMKILELGMSALGVIVNFNYPSVNTKADALKAKNMLKSSKIQKDILNHIK
jgi:3-deoxy-manno-octulosonate cytidylyltransferase (CMP-KDO synthetase)